MNINNHFLLEPKEVKPKVKVTYDNVNCALCDSPNCEYRVNEQSPYYCPRVEEWGE